MLKSTLFLLAIVFGVGCGPSPTECHGEFRVDPDGFSEQDLDDIHQAAIRINEWVGRPVVSLAPWHECVIQRGTTYPPFIGTYSDGVVKLDIDAIHSFYDDDYDAFLQGITIHELLHSFGLKHQRYDDVGIMNPAGHTEFSVGDRMECIRAGLCKD